MNFDRGAQQYIMDATARMPTDQNIKFPRMLVEEAFPRGCGYAMPMLSPIESPSSAVEVTTSFRLLTAVDQLEQMLGRDFRCAVEPMTGDYIVRRMRMTSYIRQIDPREERDRLYAENLFLNDAGAMKQAYDALARTPPRASKARPKRVKPAEKTQVSPVAQRFSGLDID
jgi:hypothetical protein